jgi:hypothetical protein
VVNHTELKSLINLSKRNILRLRVASTFENILNFQADVLINMLPPLCLYNAWAQVVDILRKLVLKETIHLIALLGIFRDIPSRKALFTKFSLAGKCVEDKLKFTA